MGVKSKKKAKTRLDAYYRLAKDQGYRARSAFKLIQLNRKYDFLGKSKSLVDLCAAPGGWCQVAAKHMPVGSKIVGVDLVPIIPIRGVKTFVGDITEDKTRKTIRTYLKKEPVDTVIHDGAPNVGGVWSRDLFSQNALVLSSCKLATELLKPGGWFISKVFRSPDYHKLLWVLKQFFTKVEATKPLASRMESAEIFVVCAGYKAPKTIDPKMFSAQHVFAEVQDEKVLTAGGAFITPKTHVPQGYEEFATIKQNIGSLAEFLDCDDPKGKLKEWQEIRFDADADRPLLNSKHSKREIVYLCNDLQQVGDADRKRLLRWREQLIKERQRLILSGKMPNPLGPSNAEQDDDDDVDSDDASPGRRVRFAAGASDDDEDVDMAAVENEDDDAWLDRYKQGEDDAQKLTEELLRIRKNKEKEMKKKEKKKVDRMLKQVKGLINYNPHETQDKMMGDALEDVDGAGPDAGGNDDDAMSESSYQEGDWTLGSLAKLPDEDVGFAFDEMGSDDGNGNQIPLDPVGDVNIDALEEIDMGKGGADAEFEGRETLQVEEGNEEAVDVDNWGNYVPAEKSTRATFMKAPGFESDEEELDEEDDEDEDDDAEAEEDETPEEARERKRLEKQAKQEEQLEEAGKQAKWKRRQLNVDQILRDTFPKPKTQKQKKSKRTEEDLVEMIAPGLGGGKSNRRGNRDDDTDSLSSLSSLGDDEDDDVAIPNPGRVDSRKKKKLVPDFGKLTVTELTKEHRKSALAANKAGSKAAKHEKQRAHAGGAASNKKKDKGKDNGAFEEIPIAMTDPEVRARTLAMATSMLDKRNRRSMLEAGVNRYMNADDGDLPDWFIKDEVRNCKVPLPVTAAAVEAERRRFQEMNVRPGKKVMEAMGRKRKKAQRVLRGLLDKGKNDPHVRNKTAGLTIRKVMRSKQLRGESKTKKNKARQDNKSKGEAKRDRQRVKKQGKGKMAGGGGGAKKGGKKKGGNRSMKRK